MRNTHTKTYRAPEFDLADNFDHKFDIWSLGCLYLDFITWVILGQPWVEKFSELRMEDNEDTVLCEEDTFFQVVDRFPWLHTRRSGVIKCTVSSHIKTLQSHLQTNGEWDRNLSHFLEFVHNRMLVINPRKRATATDVQDFFRNEVSWARKQESRDYLSDADLHSDNIKHSGNVPKSWSVSNGYVLGILFGIGILTAIHALKPQVL